MIETILVATDGSEAAASAEKYAVSLAARLRCRLLGLSVVEDRVLQGFRESSLGVPLPPLEPLEAFLKARGDAACRRLAETARAQGLEAACETAQGRPDDVIAERSQRADLLVLGRDGEHAASRTALIGSTADATLRKTARPSLVVPPGARLEGPLVLAFDGSPGSRLAAELAVELGRRLEEPVHVFVDSKDKGRALARFNEARRLLGPLAVQARETSSTLGRPDVKIVEAARDVGASMILMGAYGRSRITEYFIGSNSAAVVRTSPVAVLLAR